VTTSRATLNERTAGDPDPAGQPANEDLQAHLLDHTLRVLLRDGYQGFSMNSVARSAKASKETLYRHFGDKAGLLHAALVRSAALIGPLIHEGLDSTATRQERLKRLGLNYLHGCYLPESLALQRIAYADGRRGLGPVFAEDITERAIAYVEEEFVSLGSHQPREDAETFLGAIQGKLHEKIMLGAEIENLEAKLEAQVDHALRVMAPYLETFGNGRSECQRRQKR
jgi:AcrR family transcriptional regulator